MNASCRQGVLLCVFAIAALATVLAGCRAEGPTAANEPAAAETVRPGEVTARPSGEISEIAVADLRERLAQSRGKVVVVNLWATWCPPCVEEMPELAAFAGAQEDKDLTFLSVSADHPDTIEKQVKPFVAEQALPFPILVVGAQDPGEVGQALGTEWDGALPATLVYDRSGKLVKLLAETVTKADLEELVAPLLKAEAQPAV